MASYSHILYCMENNAEEVLPLQATPIASAYNAKVREKELVFRIDRLLKELASLKEVSWTVPMMSPPMTWVPGSTVAVNSHFFSRSRRAPPRLWGGYFPSPSP